MAYNASNLSALAYANGFTLWHYKTPDSAIKVADEGYFNEASAMLRAGDLIMVNTDIDGFVHSGMLVVRASSGGIVETAVIAFDK